MCHAEKVVHYLQRQGHSKGLYNQNMTIFTISAKMLVHLQPDMIPVQHHRPEYSVKKWDYCVQDQGHSEGSKC